MEQTSVVNAGIAKQYKGLSMCVSIYMYMFIFWQ